MGTSIVLLSKEGVTQGVPSAMKLYSIGLFPLTLKLKDSSEFVKTKWRKHDKEILKQLEQNESQHIAAFRQFPQWTQTWYADDSACISSLEEVLFTFG